jgi:FKBP-type peptidyl-prolyl cis-trans isomerase
MKFKHALSVPVAAGLLTLALSATAAETPAAAPAKPATAKNAQKPAAAKADVSNTVSYSAGLAFGESLHRAGITNEIEPAAFTKGVQAALAGKTMGDEDKQRLSKLTSDITTTIGNRNHAAAKEFLAKNGKEEGVKTTASGLQYKVAEAGAGASPSGADEVTVQYRGRLLDGTEFDSSYKRGQPATFALNAVIKGWTEGLQLMKPGAKFTFWIPPELAYDMNARAPIPPGALLVFDVELVGTKAAEAKAPEAK